MRDGNPPNYKNSDYPLSGERIGPCWRKMWSIMSDGKYHSAKTMAATAAELSGILPRTARNILWKMRTEGVLLVEKRGKRGVCWYKRADL